MAFQQLFQPGAQAGVVRQTWSRNAARSSAVGLLHRQIEEDFFETLVFRMALGAGRACLGRSVSSAFFLR